MKHTPGELKKHNTQTQLKRTFLYINITIAMKEKSQTNDWPIEVVTRDASSLKCWSG